jgi:BirA family biotin operon repressor/biotin-[acetyl-CoA-carboxylase] ligase
MPPKDPLDADKIRDGLKTKRIGRQVIVFDKVTSTNDIAAQYANEAQNDGLVIIAEEQTSGRGRGGNKWYGGKGQSVLCSIVLANETLNAELLSLTAAVAVAEAIGEMARVKWPNDVVLNGKKAAGILLESKQTKHGKVYILGVGINCHQKDFPPELASTATSIDIENQTFCDRNTFIKRLINSVEHWIDSAHAKPGKVVKEWKQVSILLGQRITVIHDGRDFTGNCVGIDPDEGLILQLDSGTLGFFPAGQTTVGKQVI